MRESLTILAIAVILVLSALLVGPYFINWDNQRDFLAAKLSKAVGAKVRITGPIDVKLLPRPIFRAGQVDIAGKGPLDPRMTVETLDAELSINGLLQGAVEFVDASLLSPHVDLIARADGSVVAPAWASSNPQAFQFKHLAITDGSLVVHDESGAVRFSLSGINAQGEAESLVGPLKVAGTVHADGTPIGFRLNTGAYAGRRLRTKLNLDGSVAPGRTEIEGFITFAPAPGVDHAVPAFEGLVNLAGSLHVADGAAPVPWRMAMTGVKGTAESLTATALELRAGAEGRALIANGGGFLALGRDPSMVLQLRARQLDLDRLAVAPEVAPDTPTPKPAQWIAALQTLLGGAGLPLSVSADLGVDAVTIGDLTLTDAAASVDAKAGAPANGRFSIAAPEGTRLTLQGALETGAVPAFTGQAALTTGNLGSVATWIEPVWPEAAGWIAKAPAVHAVDFAGGLSVSNAGFAARDIRLTVDGSTLGGTVSLKAGVGNERPRLVADLTAERLDTEHLPPLPSLAGALAPLDLAVNLAAKAAKLGSALEPIEAGRLALHFTKDGAAIALDQFSIAGLGGATVTAQASLDPDKRLRAQGHVDAAAVAPLATILHQVAPGSATDLVADHAAALSPVSIDVKAEGFLDDDGTLTPTLATGQGTVGGVRVSASVSPEPAQKFGTPLLNMTAVLDAPEAGAVLRQWGAGAVAGPLGPGHVEAKAKGSLKDGFETKATATLGDANLAFGGHLGLATGSGHVNGSGANAAPLVRAAGLAVAAGAANGPWDAETDVTWGDGQVSASKLSVHVNGEILTGSLEARRSPPSLEAPSVTQVTGALSVNAASIPGLASLALGLPAPVGAKDRWSTAKFAAVSALPRAEIALQAAAFELGSGLVAKDATMTLRTAPGSVALAGFTGHLSGGTAGATITLRRDGASASLSGQVNVADAAFDLPSLAGRLTATLDLAATGTSPDSLIGSLAGEGTLSLVGARMPRFNPDALNRVAKIFDADGAAVEDSSVRNELNGAMDKGALVLGDVTAPATVAAGTLRIVGLHTKAANFTAVSEGALDICAFTLGVRTVVTAAEPPKDWKGDLPQVTVSWSGPIAAPTRSVDAAAFVNGLAARAIARDQERIELMQDDLRERAFFARRLRQIEAEQQAARDAALIMKMGAQAGKPDTRTPKEPVAAPSPSRAVTPDDLTKLLESLDTVPLPPARPSRPNSKPVDIQPPSQAAQPGAKNGAPASDPTAAGRY